jgi:hypothetical protein
LKGQSQTISQAATPQTTASKTEIGMHPALGRGNEAGSVKVSLHPLHCVLLPRDVARMLFPSPHCGQVQRNIFGLVHAIAILRGGTSSLLASSAAGTWTFVRHAAQRTVFPTSLAVAVRGAPHLEHLNVILSNCIFS